MRYLAITLLLTGLVAIVPTRSMAADFPEVDLSLRWSTVGAFQPEYDFFATRHYSDRLNPEIGFHLLPFLTVTGEYAFSHMTRTTNMEDPGEDSFSTWMDGHLRTHTVAVGARFHPNLRGVLLPFGRVSFGVSTASVTFDTPDGGYYGHWKESDTRPELTISGGTEILFPRGVRARSHEALSGRAGRMIRNGTIGMVIEAGHVFAPAYELGRYGDLAIGQFTFELGFVAHL
jgi:hypothetical protein